MVPKRTTYETLGTACSVSEQKTETVQNVEYYQFFSEPHTRKGETPTLVFNNGAIIWVIT